MRSRDEVSIGTLQKIVVRAVGYRGKTALMRLNPTAHRASLWISAVSLRSAGSLKFHSKKVSPAPIMVFTDIAMQVAAIGNSDQRAGKTQARQSCLLLTRRHVESQACSSITNTQQMGSGRSYF